MGVADAQQWLLAAFVRTATTAGATAASDEIENTGRTLLEQWGSEGRCYHDLRHLIEVLAHVDELIQEAHEPALVQLAAWYHGSIFDSCEKTTYENRGGEDEHASAEVARVELTALGVPADRVERVAGMVSQLMGHSPDPSDVDATVLCDADLATLATEPQRYKEYVSELRREYAHIPTLPYLLARKAIISKLLARPTIFHSPLAQAWEDPARQNLTGELHRINKELTAAALLADITEPAAIPV